MRALSIIAHVRRIRSIYMQGTAFSTSPAAHGNDLVPPLANPHTSGRGRRPRRPPQQHLTEATRQANSQIGTCRARRPRRAAQQPREQAATSGEFAASDCRERACPFRAAHGPTRENPGRMRYTFAISPKVGGQRSISCRKGQAPSLRGNGCEFVQSCGKHGRSCTERRGRRSLPGRMRIRRRWRLVFAVAARRALQRKNCEFAERF